MSKEDVAWVLRRMHRDFCTCCGRALTATESILAGLGPRCASGECSCFHHRRPL